MKTQLATVTQKGQVTIPLDIRKFLGLKPYSRVGFSRMNNRIVLESTSDILDLVGKFKIPKGAPDIMKAREEMEKNYSRF